MKNVCRLHPIAGIMMRFKFPKMTTDHRPPTAARLISAVHRRRSVVVSMPELPEVETIIHGLRGPLVGRTFTGVTVLWPNSIKTPISELEQRLPGQRIEAITRRAKYLQFHLSHGDSLFLHLKMSGDLLVEPASEPCHPHVRTIFGLDNGHELR